MSKQFRLPFNMTIFHIIGILIALILIISSYFLFNTTNPNLFTFILGIAFVIGGLPFFLSIISETNQASQKEAMFLEFSRGLVEGVKAGTPISKSIFNIKSKDYGSLNPHVEKLANQISLGIPINTAFETFARDIGSKTIARSVNIISEAEKAGGRIDDILESVVKSVSQVERLKKERKSSMYTLVVQGYIIFLIFIVIMLVMQFKVLPIASQLGGQFASAGSAGIPTGIVNIGGMGGGTQTSPQEMVKPFVWLLAVQGFFAGLVIGKLSEGNIKAGLKHSFILIVLSFLIQTGANLFLGNPMAIPLNVTG
jgi:archaeal flagellar protein FlaJ